MKIDWKRKLTSRKFWVALINFITNIMIAFNVPENQIAQVTAIVLAGAGLIAYVLAEGWIDVEAVKQPELEFSTVEAEDKKQYPIGFKAGGELND